MASDQEPGQQLGAGAAETSPAADAEADAELEAQRRQTKKINYKEDVMTDRQFEALLKTDEELQRLKRRRTDDDNSPQGRFSGQLEQETAWAVDFNAMAINEEEEELLPAAASEHRYVQMRNYVLTKWRSNVSRYLSEEAALSGLPWYCREYARTAWRFLDTSGYINFGVAQEMLERAEIHGKPKGTIIIVGAGLAGLAAAQHLRKLGYEAVILEGHSRPGGRVYTKRLEAEGIEAVADLGGSILTGIDGNPMAVIAKQLQIPMHDIEQTEVPIYLGDGSTPPKALDEEVEADYNKLLDQCAMFRDNLGEIADNIALGTPLEQFWEDLCSQRAAASGEAGPEEAALKQRLFNWHTANVEFANAASYKELSVRSWDQDDPHELPGTHCFLPGGNLRLVAALAEGVPVLYNSRVQKVSYAKNGVAVKTATHLFKGDAVLVTVPLGVLKRGCIQFQPALSARKQEAIKRLGFGLLNKIVLLFREPFWGNTDMFGRLAELSEQRGEFYLFYSYTGLSGGAVLAALVSGDAAKEFEKISSEEATTRVMAVLRGIFEPRGVEVPPPLQVCCTRWGQDEMAFGSYSSMAVGALGGEDYDVLAENVGGRLFFAGEATTRKYPATMHGAFLSGLREAANMHATFTQATRSAAQAAVKLETAEDAFSVSLALAEAGEKAAKTAIFAAKLEKVFSNPKWPPEAEFDCFAAIGGPTGSEWEQQALLRIDLGAAKGRIAAKNTHVYVVISATDLYRLQDVGGGSDARFGFLAGLPDLKLVGRQEISEDCADFVQAILVHRGVSTKGPQRVVKPVVLGNGHRVPSVRPAPVLNVFVPGATVQPLRSANGQYPWKRQFSAASTLLKEY